MKKILIFSLNYFPKYVGGAEVAIKEIVERVDRNKFEFHMVTLRFDSNLPKFEILHGIHIYRIGFTKTNATLAEMRHFPLYFNKYFFQIFAGFYGFYLHLQHKYDAAWSMMPTATGVPTAILKILTFGKLKTIITFQEGDPIPHMVKHVLPAWPLFTYSIKSANVVQAISTFLLNWAKDLGFKGYGLVVPNAVDVKNFIKDIPQEQINDIKKNIKKNDNEIWLITTSRLVHKNGIDNVIQAIQKLDNKYNFAVLGIGPEENNYKKLTNDLGVENRVHFLGQVNHSQMPAYLKVCDIFIRPSRSEGMGNSFVEAMAMKMPVIATRVGGLSDFIFEDNQKQTAWVCKTDDPESIVSAVTRIENLKLENLEKFNKIINDSYNMVLEKYDWELIAKEMEDKVFGKI